MTQPRDGEWPSVVHSHMNKSDNDMGCICVMMTYVPQEILTHPTSVIVILLDDSWMWVCILYRLTYGN